MAAAKMRHFNSPEELAKRQGEPAPAVRGQGFRHYNSPDEIAKREGRGAAVVVPPRQRRVLQAEGWPPPGQENTALVTTNAAPPPPRKRAPLTGDAVERLEQLEELVYAMLDSPSEAREFRMHMSNFVAVVESQRDLITRVRALEKTVDQLTGDDEDEDDDGDSQPPSGGAGTPPPTEPTP